MFGMLVQLDPTYGALNVPCCYYYYYYYYYYYS